MKFDLNKIVILFLLLSTFGFGLAWFFSTSSSETKEEKIKLEKDYANLKKEGIIIDEKIKILKNIYIEKDKQDKITAQQVINAKLEAIKAKENAEKAKSELLEIKINMTKTLKEIEILKKNQKVLTDDELLQELIKKLK